MEALAKNYSNNILVQRKSQVSNTSILSRFMSWCDSFENYRFPVAGALIIIQGCIVAPAVLLVVSFLNTGYSDLSVLIMALMTFAVLVSNIAILPMRAVLGIFSLNTIISLGIICLHLVQLLQ